MHRGYIKLWRKIEDWTWHNDLQTLGFFVHLLKKANHKDSVFQGVFIPRGSLICGRKQLAEQFKIGERRVRTMLTRLKSTNDLTIKTTNRFSIISIVNYNLYQENTTNRLTNGASDKRPTKDQQKTTSKECKECKNEKNTTPGEDFIEKLKANAAYKDLNINRCLAQMDAWLLLHKGRKKTPRFILGWLNRELERQPLPAQAKSTSAALNSARAELDKWKKEAAPMPKECRDQLTKFGIRSEV